MSKQFLFLTLLVAGGALLLAGCVTNPTKGMNPFQRMNYWCMQAAQQGVTQAVTVLHDESKGVDERIQYCYALYQRAYSQNMKEFGDSLNEASQNFNKSIHPKRPAIPFDENITVIPLGNGRYRIRH